MDFVGAADLLTGFVYGIIKILAYGAAGVVLVGIVTTCCCCFFECKRWRHVQGKSEVWRLIH
ncbi:MAG: hypothetical protein IH583_03450 [Candidatus Aminicenantes bacterium]|nr:hypothetical protein [Candidatus Aminicenantes bacterium]